MALEAGRKRGSIKKSRHAALVEAIELAVREVGKKVLSPTQQIEKTKSKTKIVKTYYEQLKEGYEKLLENCNSLLLENFELKKSTSLKDVLYFFNSNILGSRTSWTSRCFVLFQHIRNTSPSTCTCITCPNYGFCSNRWCCTEA